MAAKLLTAAGGGITLDAASTATDKTLTLPARTGNMAVDGPAFSAYQSSAQTLSNNSWTKIQLQSEYFDTASAFDQTTNYRFQPSVAGYYQLNVVAQAFLFSALGVSIYKNGSGLDYAVGTGTSGQLYSTVAQSKLVYMNGSTDYVELYAYQASGGAVNTVAVDCAFSGFLARAA
jgi:hypothetical protein